MLATTTGEWISIKVKIGKPHADSWSTYSYRLIKVWRSLLFFITESVAGRKVVWLINKCKVTINSHIELLLPRLYFNVILILMCLKLYMYIRWFQQYITYSKDNIMTISSLKALFKRYLLKYIILIMGKKSINL